MPHPLDEYPIHQLPLSMRYVGSSDRNFYDRFIVHAFRRDGSIEMLAGLGVYPNLGVIDAYVNVRKDGRSHVVRTSDALGEDRMAQAVGPIRLEIIEPLKSLRLVCDGDEYGVSCDLVWESAFPGVDEPLHVNRRDACIFLEGCRFVQTGVWTGVIRVDGEELTVSDPEWSGTRDRSWGIRPSGEAEPPGRAADDFQTDGFYWIWTPLRFDDYQLVVIMQEDSRGSRMLHEAVRVFPESSGRAPEQLGFPEIDITYTPGTRHPERATLHLGRRGAPMTVEVETLGFVALNVGCGYGGDPDWTHGVWKGPKWVEGMVYDLADPAVRGRTPFSVIDHVARGTCDGEVGTGIFELGTFGRHDPSGFTGWDSVARLTSLPGGRY